MPRATDDPTALLRRPNPGNLIVLDGFPGPPISSVYFEYWGAHPYAGHCPYAYLLRVADGEAYDLPGLWDLWRWFVAGASTPPPGVEIEWEGFPFVQTYFSGPNDLWSDVPEGSFDGLFTEGMFESSPSGAPLGPWYEFRPAGDSAYAGMDLIRARAGPGNPFITSTSMCV